jgi:hypothetical protein
MPEAEAPVATPETPVATPETPVAAAATPAKPDPELIIEKALQAEREASAAKKAADAAAQKYGKHAPILDLLEKSDANPTDLIEAILKDRGGLNESLLYELAKKFPDNSAEPTEEQKLEALVNSKLAAAEKAKQDAEDKRRKDEEAAQIEQGKAELEAHLTSAAKVLEANLDKFIGIKAMGASDVRYRALMIEAIDRNEEPDPLKIYEIINNEHVAKLKAAGIIKGDEVPAGAPAPAESDRKVEPGSLEEHAAKIFNLHKPKDYVPGSGKTSKPDPADEARANLIRWDAEQSERVKYSRQ